MFKKITQLFDKPNKGKEQHSKKKHKESKPIYAPNTKIAYRPKLVDKLKEEHVELVRLFNLILSMAEKGETENTRKLLAEFKGKFSGHLIKENINFYVYVEHSVKDLATLELIKEMKLEMDGIAKTVREFIAKFSQPNMPLDENFLKEFKNVGAALLERVNREEEFLYPTYQPVMS